MKRLVFAALLGAAASGLVAACSSGPANYPDAKTVADGQAAWCDGLSKVRTASGSSADMSTCKAFPTTASGPYLRAMIACYSERLQRDGDNAPDNQIIVEECNNEATVAMNGDEKLSAEVIGARCARMERCEKVSVADCKKAIDKLETAQRAVFTTTYNAAALHKVSECLEDASCTEDEDAAREACYKPVQQGLLWFP